MSLRTIKIAQSGHTAPDTCLVFESGHQDSRDLIMIANGHNISGFVGKKNSQYYDVVHTSHGKFISCHPTFTDKKVSPPQSEKIKSFAQVSLTKFLVNQIDKNVAMATSK